VRGERQEARERGEREEREEGERESRAVVMRAVYLIIIYYDKYLLS
jgi:hypothetical protein